MGRVCAWGQQLRGSVSVVSRNLPSPVKCGIPHERSVSLLCKARAKGVECEESTSFSHHTGASSISDTPTTACSTTCNENSNAPLEVASDMATRFWLSARSTTCLDVDLTLFAGLVAVACLGALALPEASHAEELSGGAFDFFRQLVDQIEALGPAGPLLLIFAILLTELVPLFPTQPLSITSGLLFGPVKGTIITLAGCCLASFTAFYLSRGIGKSLAQKVIAFEMAPEHQKPGDKPNEHNHVAQKFVEMKKAVETGSFGKQLTAIVLLRLTPIVPFSASNYVIGLTSIPFPPFALGTVFGIAGYCLLYASLGGAGRVLLEGGEDLSTVMTSLLDQAGGYSSTIGKAVLGAACVAGLGYFAVSNMKGKSSSGASATPTPTPLELPAGASSDAHGLASHGSSSSGSLPVVEATERELEEASISK